MEEEWQQTDIQEERIREETQFRSPVSDTGKLKFANASHTATTTTFGIGCPYAMSGAIPSSPVNVRIGII